HTFIVTNSISLNYSVMNCDNHCFAVFEYRTNNGSCELWKRMKVLVPGNELRCLIHKHKMNGYYQVSPFIPLKNLQTHLLTIHQMSGVVWNSQCERPLAP